MLNHKVIQFNNVFNRQLINITPKNIAILFIKPHLSGNSDAQAYIRVQLADHGIVVLDERVISGQEIKGSGLIDRHYSVNARPAITAPADLSMPEEAKQKFFDLFGVEWDEQLRLGKIISGCAALQKLNISPLDLNEAWVKQSHPKIDSGVYVSKFITNSGSFFVLNGFYPAIQEKFTTPDAHLICFRVDLNGLDWEKFRALIGPTNPAEASLNTIRGGLYGKQKDFGIHMDGQDNGLHGSASPLEALFEKSIWLNFSFQQEELGNMLLRYGLTVRDIQQWQDNPEVVYNGEKKKVFDLVENKNLKETAEILEAIKVAELAAIIAGDLENGSKIFLARGFQLQTEIIKVITNTYGESMVAELIRLTSRQ